MYPAKYPGNCVKCGGAYAPGDDITHQRGAVGRSHAPQCDPVVRSHREQLDRILDTGAEVSDLLETLASGRLAVWPRRYSMALKVLRRLSGTLAEAARLTVPPPVPRGRRRRSR